MRPKVIYQKRVNQKRGEKNDSLEIIIAEKFNYNGIYS